jgi:hypothetical protein
LSWDGTLSSGGVQKHGTAQHITQGNPGTYAMPCAITFDAAGAESAAYQAWSATPTFPANTYVLGSDSKLYRAVISNAGNDPTTDGGSHWIRVSIPTGGTAGGQVPLWDNTAKEYSPGTVTGTVPNGVTTNDTLRWNGTAWADSGYIRNSDSQVTINSPTSPPSGVPLVVKSAGTGAQPSGITIVDETSSDPVCLTVLNSGNGSGMQFGLSGTADGFMPGTTQGDGVVRLQKDGKRVWIGSKLNPSDTTGTAIMALDQTGVVIGSTGAASAKLDVTAGAGPALNLTGVSGQKVAILAGTSAGPALDISNSANTLVTLTNSGSALWLTASTAASGAGSRYGVINMGKNVSGTLMNLVSLAGYSEEDNTTNRGGKLQVVLGTLNNTNQTTRADFRANGDVSLNASGAEQATSTQDGFTFLPTVNGVPSGTPRNGYTGAAPFVFDRADNVLYAYNNSVWNNISGSQRAVNNFTSGPQTITTAMAGYVSVSGSISITCNLPTAASATGLEYTFATTSTTGCVVHPNGTDKIAGANSNQTVTSGYHSLTIWSNGTEWFAKASA